MKLARLKLALLNGNRFNPWHFQGYKYIKGQPEITAFRAESEIQQFFDARDDGSAGFRFEQIYFDTQAGSPIARLVKSVQTNYLGREPRILPFYERLQGFDLIHSWELFTDWSEQALIAHQKYGAPLLVMVWDNIPFNMERNPFRRDLKKRVAAGADLFVVHTERSRRMLGMEGVDASRIVLVNPGVDTARFCPGPRDRSGFGLDDGDFVILFVGWFLPRKGMDYLLLALHELLHDPACNRRRVRLLAVGSGPGKDRIDRLVERLNLGESCVFTGSLPYNRMPDAFRAADVFVLPSIATPEWQEQFGMSLIEAMSCGTPVVSTLSGAISEIVGDSGILCQPNDFVSILDALKRLMLNPGLREDLAAKGRQRALDLFTLEQFAGGLSGAYARLI
ncbi:MAG: glycosyltransferase [Candidatus Hydrogenedentes bacterium]|nr:glycosyltransferase [Candidatus Hydrogenedentota bacterium]